MRVLADEVFVRRVRVQLAVGEVGPATARDADFFGHFVAVVQHQHPQTPLARHTGTKQPAAPAPTITTSKFSMGRSVCAVAGAGNTA
jgi:hypothetical protein